MTSRAGRASVWVIAAAIALAGAGCRTRAYVRAAAPPPAASGGVTIVQPQPQYAQDQYAQGQGYAQGQAYGAGVQASAELLYLPVDASMIPLHLIQAVQVQTSDGRQFQITQADVVQGMGGRIAVRIPAGVTTGTATVYLVNGQTWSTTFHIAASSSGASVGIGPVTGGPAQAQGPVGDARCTLPAGTWQGTISDDPNSRSTVWLEVLGDCRTVRGYVHLESSSGSVDSTIEGSWDPYSYAIVARDTQLFNVQPLPGGAFCATDEYRLQMSPDARSLSGQNIIYSAPCQGSSRVWLAR